MSKPVFKYECEWAHGYHFYKADAQKVGEEIYSISETPSTQQIVDKARDENTILHNLFEWDDDIAGEKYRNIQAQNIIRTLVVRKIPCGEEMKETKPIRMFVSTGKKDGTYTPIHRVVKNVDLYQQTLEKAYAELRAFKTKYAHLAELKEIIELIEN